jgi:hypothetical protein
MAGFEDSKCAYRKSEDTRSEDVTLRAELRKENWPCQINV